jgi:hypothetical protein
MTSVKAKARKLLEDTVVKQVLPRLRTAGFVELPQPKEAIPMWNLHRRRGDGGYDVISVIFDKKRRPYFYGIINVVDTEGIRQPWGEFIEASRATAITPLKRILIQKKRKDILAVVLGKWFSHGWFGFCPGDSAAANQAVALEACNEFVDCLGQAEQWWANRELGPNLVRGEVDIRMNPRANQ